MIIHNVFSLVNLISLTKLAKKTILIVTEMKNFGAKIKLFTCVALVVACVFLASINLTSQPCKTVAETVNANEISFDDFSAALTQMTEEYEPTENSLVFFEKESELTMDADGEYLVTEQIYCQLTGTNKLTKNGLVLRTQSTPIYYLNDLAEATGYQVTDNEDTVILTRKYGLKRLIIYSDSNDLDTCGAVATVKYHNLHFYQYATEEQTRAAYEYYQNCPAVTCVAVDRYCWTQSDSTNYVTIDTNAELSYETWGAEKMGVPKYAQYLMDTVKAQNNNINALPEVVVAVLDTGIRTSHPWFTDRMLKDSHGKYIGVNYTPINKTAEYAFEDDQGHGTHCSGIICDMTLPNVKILPVKFMWQENPSDTEATGYMSNAIKGIEYVIQMKQHYNIVAMNMSFGTDKMNIDEINQFTIAINNAYNAGIFSVVAAGNEHKNAGNFAPASVSKAITVSALKKFGSYEIFDSEYSNFGSVIDVCAPGTSIKSAYHTKDLHYLSGTSMATPHVVAYIALLESELSSSLSHDYTQDEINRILNGEVNGYLKDLGPTGKDDEYGNGMPILTAAIPDYVMVNVITNDLGTTSVASGYNMYTKGSNVTITFTPDENAYVTAVYVDDILVPNSAGLSEYTLSMNKNRTLKICFETNSYTVTRYFEKVYDLNSNEPHEYDIHTEKLTGDIGSSTAAQSKNYPGFTEQPFEQSIITSNGKTTVEIYYLRNKYQLTIQPATGDKGISKLEGSGEYLFGTPLEIRPTFYNGFYIDVWVYECTDTDFLNQLKPTAARQKFTMPAADLTMTAFSQSGVYTITTKVSGHGTVTPDEVAVHYGDAMILELTADEGYQVQTVTRDGVKITPIKESDNTYSVNLYNITANTEIEVVFAESSTVNANNDFGKLILNGGWVAIACLFIGSFVLLVFAFRTRRR